MKQAPLRTLLFGGIVLSALLPLILLALWSVSLRWYYPSLLPGELSSRAWASLADPASRVPEALFGSLWVASAASVVGVLIALPAARVLASGKMWGEGLITVLLLAPLVLPSFASAMGVQVVFVRLGLSDTRLGVALAHLIPVTPYAVTLLTGIFRGYDSRLEEQARMLGASKAAVLLRVTLPLILPGLLATLLFAFLVSWSEYLLTLLIGGGQVLTLPLLLFALAAGGDYPITAALSLVYVAPPLLVFALTSRLAGGWRT